MASTQQAPGTMDLGTGELISALSHALDLTEGQPAGHCVRCCWIGMQIGDVLGFDDHQLADLYYAILLKDLGCSSNAARICSHYFTDDITFKHDAKLIDGSLSQALGFILSHTGMNAGMARRFRALYSALKSGAEMAHELIETRCHRGGDIALKMRFSDRVADAIRSLDEHWDGSGQPDRKVGDEIPVISQIALLSQVVDVFHTNAGRETAMREIRLRSGNWFSPQLVSAFETAAGDSDFWFGLEDPHLDKRIYQLEPALTRQQVDGTYLDDIAEAFAEVVDSKSPFTAGHSERVTVYADLIAGQLGYEPGHRRWLRRGALLHDIGKLGISNSILDKPGKLDDEEFAAIKKHPVYSREILERVGAFSDIVTIAECHHERLDGKGYPNGFGQDDLNLDVRIVTVADIFDALTADRPYRKAMPEEKAMSILQGMAGDAIDPQCLEALQTALVDFRKEAA